MTLSDVFILCFSVVNPVSFQSITSKWIPQIRTFHPASPIILVGSQLDRRHDFNILIHLDQLRDKPVVSFQVRGLADKIRAHDYVEFSTVTQKNLKEAFDSAIFVAIKHKTCQKAKKLNLLYRAKTFSNGGWKKFFCFI
ncbi:rho-related GTP-binding protein RhoV-like [Salvelinus fontinalis]|uniref:rho-related GTP-binding protein RhoV-like n=1 Tax=Salvelinus fontinalis TaxID=8038 RepID=UPI002486CCCF|nr:rho-related GTP-binding protein RhoV-like [Salvelinus fontinalis]